MYPTALSQMVGGQHLPAHHLWEFTYLRWKTPKNLQTPCIDAQMTNRLRAQVFRALEQPPTRVRRS